MEDVCPTSSSTRAASQGAQRLRDRGAGGDDGRGDRGGPGARREFDKCDDNNSMT
jgi:hypothetical protein